MKHISMIALIIFVCISTRIMSSPPEPVEIRSIGIFAGFMQIPLGDGSFRLVYYCNPCIGSSTWEDCPCAKVNTGTGTTTITTYDSGLNPNTQVWPCSTYNPTNVTTNPDLSMTYEGIVSPIIIDPPIPTE